MTPTTQGVRRFLSALDDFYDLDACSRSIKLELQWPYAAVIGAGGDFVQVSLKWVLRRSRCPC
jgi:hypothetical protein